MRTGYEALYNLAAQLEQDVKDNTKLDESNWHGGLNHQSIEIINDVAAEIRHVGTLAEAVEKFFDTKDTDPNAFWLMRETVNHNRYQYALQFQDPK